RHLELIAPVVRDALERARISFDGLDRIAVTQGPGLVGALLVGISTAKAMAWSTGVPLVPVDHLDGHVAALYLGEDPLEPPFVCLLASGGHTLLLAVHEHGRSERLGSTLDDAAGEAFDKGARLLGLGYPGGVELDRIARHGDPEAFSFPVARVSGLDFSFSGLKTALLYTVRKLGEAETERRRTDLAASFERAIVRALAERAREAVWQGVVGVHPPVSTAKRYVVVLRLPSLSSRVEAAGGEATEADMRRWTSAAASAQEQFLARMAASGARLTREYHYVRVLNGFSARLDPTTLELLERDREVAGVYPVRIAYPAVDERSSVVTPAAAPGLDIPGLDGSGVTVALLDTGVDPSHPYLRDSILTGLDVIDPGSGGIAQPNPSVPGRPERHGTELAGVVSGSDGPDGLHGSAPGASILPVRIAGWQPDAEGGYAVYSRTDQIIAGLEAAVDPNADG